METKYCPYPRCVLKVPLTQSCCPIHWKELPKPIRDLAFDMDQECKAGKISAEERDAKWKSVLENVDKAIIETRERARGKPEIFPAAPNKSTTTAMDAYVAVAAKRFLRLLDAYLQAKAQNLASKKARMDDLVRERRILEKVIEEALKAPQKSLFDEEKGEGS